jgi:guanidinobutyrase
MAARALKVSKQAFFFSGISRLTARNQFNHPKSGNELSRAGGISSLFRLPVQEAQPEGLDACFVGIPMDIGCSNRSGTRHGPRAIRHESVMIRHIGDLGACPFESLQVADVGDVPVIPYNIQRTIDVITDYFLKIMEANCVPLSMGGDHTMSYPILRAIKKKHGAVGLIQIDAHQDLQDTMLGEKVAHGTPFRRALEEDLVDPKHFVQIGLRSSLNRSDIEEQIVWAQKQVPL